MRKRTGTLKERTSILTIKSHGEPDEHVYAEAGSIVTWDGARSNAGHEYCYGDRHLLWTDILHKGNWYGKGLEESEVDWWDERSFSRARKDYERYIQDGQCPCCFPHWEYPEMSVQDMWNWEDEMNAWKTYSEWLERDE